MRNSSSSSSSLDSCIFLFFNVLWCWKGFCARLLGLTEAALQPVTTRGGWTAPGLVSSRWSHSTQGGQRQSTVWLKAEFLFLFWVSSCCVFKLGAKPIRSINIWLNWSWEAEGLRWSFAHNPFQGTICHRQLLGIHNWIYPLQFLPESSLLMSVSMSSITRTTQPVEGSAIRVEREREKASPNSQTFCTVQRAMLQNKK